jgi:hypothetical protein
MNNLHIERVNLVGIIYIGYIDLVRLIRSSTVYIAYFLLLGCCFFSINHPSNYEHTRTNPLVNGIRKNKIKIMKVEESPFHPSCKWFPARCCGIWERVLMTHWWLMFNKRDASLTSWFTMASYKFSPCMSIKFPHSNFLGPPLAVACCWHVIWWDK